MQYFLWTLLSIIAYIVGLVMLLQVTPRLFRFAFDEPAFIGVAALDILAGLLTFGTLFVTYSVFNGNFPIKVLDFFLLIGILAVSIRLALSDRKLRTITGTSIISWWLAEIYCLFLALASFYCIIQLFFIGS